MAKTTAAVAQWRYSMRWRFPHRPCPGPRELASALVPAGAPCPPGVSEAAPLGGRYAVHVDFPPAGAVRTWSLEAKARTRLRNLAQRLERHAPLFAEELFAREVASRPAYFTGAVERPSTVDDPQGD